MGGFVRAVRRFFRFLFVASVVLVVLVAAASVGAVVFRKPAAEILIRQALGFSGYPNADLHIAEFSEQRLKIAAIRLEGETGSIRTVDITYNLSDVWRGQLGSVAIDGVRFELDLNNVEGGTSSKADRNWVRSRILKSGALVTISDIVVSVLNSPIGDVELTASGAASFLETPAAFDLQFSTVPLDDQSPLLAFAFSGGGSVTQDGIDIRGPTRVSFANGYLSGWGINRLDYDNDAHLKIKGPTAQFALSAPIDLSIRQVQPDEEDDSPNQSVPVVIDLKTGRAQVTADWSDGFSGSAEITDGEIEVTPWGLSGGRIQVSVPFDGDQISDTATVRGYFSDTAEQTRFSPQTIEASFRQDDDGMFLMRAAASPGGKPARLTLAGRYNPQTGEGGVNIGPDILRFTEDGLQPDDISPRLNSFRNTSGVVRISGEIEVAPGAPPAGQAVVTLKDVDTDFTVMSFEGISGTLNIIDIFDPRSPPGQTFQAESMTAPVPLSGPAISLHWVRTGDDPLIRIESARGGFAEGTISLKETLFRLTADENDITLVFDGISLKALFEEWAGGRVSGAGTLSGGIPVTLGPDGPIILDGELAADSKGFIKVHWGDARDSLERQGNEVALMVQVLDDFRYRVLKVGVRRPPDGELTLIVQLEGANPEVLDDYPFRINVNLSGDLEDILAAIAEGQSLTQDLLRARVNDGN